MDAADLRSYLKKLVNADQKRLTDLGAKLGSVNSLEEKLSLIKPVAKECQMAAKDMLQTISKSKIKPTIPNIGTEASSAVILVALHSHIGIMRAVSQLFHKFVNVNKKVIPLQYLAVLDDRIQVISTRTQNIGTVTYFSSGKEYLVPINDIDNLEQRRSSYLLPKLKLEKIKQRPLSNEDYLLNFAFMDQEIL